FLSLPFKSPPPQVQKKFMASFNGSVSDYEKLLREIHQSEVPELENDNFDTGTVTLPGQYPLADTTYADLLDHQAKDHFAETTPELRETILSFYADTNAPITTKKDPQKWAKVLQQVTELKSAELSAPGSPGPTKSPAVPAPPAH